MQISVESLSGLERKLQVTISSEMIEYEVKIKLEDVAKKTKMPGFRPGKVPFDVIKKKYYDATRAEILENMIRESYVDALQKEKLNPIGMPSINVISSKNSESFVYTANFEVYPEIKLNDFKQVEVEKIIASVTDADVDAMLEKIRKRHATWQEVARGGRKSKEGDQLIIEYTTRPCDECENLEPKTQKDVKFVLGDGSMWTDFEKSLYGVEADEEKRFILQTPDTHIDKTIADKKVEFTVQVHKVSEPILPVLDDEFANKMNIKEGGIGKLREEVRFHIERELDGVLKGLFKQEVMNKLLELNPIEVPKSLVTNELKRKEEEWNRSFAQSSQAKENTPKFLRANFEEQARRGVTLGLLMAAIIKDHQFAVGHSEIRNKTEDLVGSYYEDKDEMVKKLLADQKHLVEIESILLEEKVMEYLVSLMQTREKHVSYKYAVSKNNVRDLC